MDLQFHEIAEWFPLMDEAALQELAADIQANGQQESIKLYQGKIVDGRNRYNACRLGGIEPWTEEVCPEDPVKYVFSRNFHRRDLTPSQRAMVATRMKDYYAALTKEQQRASIDARREENGQINADGAPAKPESATGRYLDGGKSSEKAAKLVKVSPRSVDRATKVRKDGIPALGKLVEAGNLDVTKAVRIAALPRDTQETILEDAKRNDWSPGMMMEEVKRLSPKPRELPRELPREQQKADSPVLQELKAAWKRASKEDHKSFLEWAKA